MTAQLPDLDALRALIARWEAAARMAQEQVRQRRVVDTNSAHFYQGVERTFLQVADDLRALIDVGEPAPEPPPLYLAVHEHAVRDLFQRAGLFPRVLHAHADHAFTAVFPKLQPISQEKRIAALTAADPRVIILDQGKLPDTGDPFIDFAFRAE